MLNEDRGLLFCPASLSWWQPLECRIGETVQSQRACMQKVGGCGTRPSSAGAVRPRSATAVIPGRVQPARSSSLGQGPAPGPAPLVNALQCTHPDAIRRRREAEARRAAAQMEVQTARQCSWWDCACPANLVSASRPEELQNLVAQDRLVVVDFFAPWCAACRRLFPKLRQLAENNPDVLFVKVNGGEDALGKFVESLGVDKLPYFHFYRCGQIKAHFAANLTKVNLLRAEIAAHKECREPSCIL